MPDDDDALARQNAALTRALLEWVASAPRTYGELIDTWRSSCPRHAILEDAQAAGLIDHDGRANGIVHVTAAGARMLG
ncbi:MAG: hypothetical protein ACM3JC_02785 [Rudaea sp.]